MTAALYSFFSMPCLQDLFVMNDSFAFVANCRMKVFKYSDLQSLMISISVLSMLPACSKPRTLIVLIWSMLDKSHDDIILRSHCVDCYLMAII